MPLFAFDEFWGKIKFPFDECEFLISFITLLLFTYEIKKIYQDLE